MSFRLVVQLNGKLGFRRLLSWALWVAGGGALVGTVFVVSFFLAMRAEMRPRWQGMSDEERAAARDRHHGQRDGGRHPGGRRGDK